MNRSFQFHTVLAATLLAALALGACTTLRVESARLALPEALADGAPGLQLERLAGASHGRSGRTQLGGLSVRFERGADALGLLGRIGLDRVTLRLELEQAGARTEGRCAGRQTELRLGGGSAAVTTSARPYTLECRFEGAQPATLRLAERRGATQLTREGEIEAGGQRLVLRSLHRLQGSALATAEPVGYIIESEGRALAAVDLSSATPRLRRAGASPAALDSAISQASLVVALMFEPGGALN